MLVILNIPVVKPIVNAKCDTFINFDTFFFTKPHLLCYTAFKGVDLMANEVLSNITITNIASVLRLFNPKSAGKTYRKKRDRWALALKTQGKTLYSAKGKTYTSDALHPIILPKGCEYSWKCLESGEFIIVEFDALEEYSELISFEIADNGFFISAFDKIEKCLAKENANQKLKAKHLLYGVLYDLVKTLSKEYTSKDKLKLLSPATEYMQSQYYDCDISNDQLAGLCGISTVYFRKTFESVYGASPIKFLHNLRIEKAKAILQSDYDSIGQVAESVGYNSIYHFSKMFKLYTGTNPTEYVKSVGEYH